MTTNKIVVAVLIAAAIWQGGREMPGFAHRLSHELEHSRAKVHTSAQYYVASFLKGVKGQ